MAYNQEVNMPKKIQNIELTELTEKIHRHAHGMSVSELLALTDYTRRTLQRRLENLLTNGLIRAEGEGRGRRYLGVQEVAQKTLTPYYATTSEALLVVAESDGTEIELSAEGVELKALITQPLWKREPVGYQADFLNSYVPNQTYYLPASTRKELAELGKLSDENLPAGTYLRHILNRLLIDLSWNSSRLEGNTYSLLETEKLLEHGETCDGKNTREAQMILNHKSAIEMLADQTQEIGFNRYTVCNLHALLADNLISTQQACGSIRDCAVGIGGSTYMPLEIPQVIDGHYGMILQKAAAIEDPMEASFFVMVHLPYLQAFEDVNKRTSRLAANIPMVMKNLCPLSFTEVDRNDYLCANLAVYELNRIEYLRDLFIWAYKRSCKRYSVLKHQLGEPDPFKFKYRTQMKEIVRDIVRDGLTPTETESYTEQCAVDHIPANEHHTFRLLLVSELNTLHEGNIMRYRLRPAEFRDWKKKQ